MWYVDSGWKDVDRFLSPEFVDEGHVNTHCHTVYRNFLFVYYKSIKREPKMKSIHECRCDKRLQTKTNEFTRLSYTGLVVELEHLKIKTRLTNEFGAGSVYRDRFGSSSDPSLNGHLHYPNDIVFQIGQ